MLTRGSMPLMDNLLITGTNSGLGKFLKQSNPNCLYLNRENRDEVIKKAKNFGPINIIHCAFNSSREIKNYYQYVNDNIFLTKQLLEIPHNKFVFISSIDVYQEDFSAYKFSKLTCESMVSSLSNNWAVLRCSAIVGPTMRYNTFLKMLEEREPNLSLSKESTFNYVLQEDINKFILKSIEQDITGIFDFVSTDCIKLEELSTIFNCKPQYGNYTYSTKNISDSRIFKYIKKNNKQVITEFLKNYE